MTKQHHHKKHRECDCCPETVKVTTINTNVCHQKPCDWDCGRCRQDKEEKDHCWDECCECECTWCCEKKEKRKHKKKEKKHHDEHYYCSSSESESESECEKEEHEEHKKKKREKKHHKKHCNDDKKKCHKKEKKHRCHKKKKECCDPLVKVVIVNDCCDNVQNPCEQTLCNAVELQRALILILSRPTPLPGEVFGLLAQANEYIACRTRLGFGTAPDVVAVQNLVNYLNANPFDETARGLATTALTQISLLIRSCPTARKCCSQWPSCGCQGGNSNHGQWHDWQSQQQQQQQWIHPGSGCSSCQGQHAGF